MDRIVDINVEQEFVGTPLTHAILMAEGFRYKLDELSSEEAEIHPDPFYYYKGEFRVYDVIDDYYVRNIGSTSTGVRVQSLEALQEAYIGFMGRSYTKDVVLEDTPPPDYAEPRFNYDASLFIKIKLVGGPGDGKVMIWPKKAHFFVYQTKKKVGNREVTEGWNYQRRKNRKTIYDYAGPTPD